MNTVAFKMKLKPGSVSEYRKRHDEIWPELADAIREAGISDYSIFLDEESFVLFAIQKQADSAKAGTLPDHPVVRKWWDYMAPLMEVNADNSPVTAGLHRMFHLD